MPVLPRRRAVHAPPPPPFGEPGICSVLAPAVFQHSPLNHPLGLKPKRSDERQSGVAGGQGHHSLRIPRHAACGTTNDGSVAAEAGHAGGRR